MERTRILTYRASLELGVRILGLISRSRRFRSVGVCVIAFFLTAGCDDLKDSTAAAQSLPKDEFIARADELCTEAGEKYDALIASLPAFDKITAPDVPHSVMAEVGKAAAPLADIEGDLERELRGLRPPAAFASRWSRALDNLGKRADLALVIGDAAAVGDRKAYLDGFRRFAREGTIGSRELSGYGFRVCGTG